MADTERDAFIEQLNMSTLGFFDILSIGLGISWASTDRSLTPVTPA